MVSLVCPAAAAAAEIELDDEAEPDPVLVVGIVPAIEPERKWTTWSANDGERVRSLATLRFTQQNHDDRLLKHVK